jgi:hypothetical protein
MLKLTRWPQALTLSALALSSIAQELPKRNPAEQITAGPGAAPAPAPSDGPAVATPSALKKAEEIPLDPETKAFVEAFEGPKKTGNELAARTRRLRKRAFFELRQSKIIPRPLNDAFVQLEDDFFNYIRSMESLLDKIQNTEKILNPVKSNVYSTVIFSVAVHLTELGSLKGIVSTRQQESDMEQWIRRYSVRIPRNLWQITDEIVMNLNNRWGKSYSNFLSFNEGETHTRFMLNPNYLAFASMGYRFQREVSDENFLALAQYFATDQLQTSWQNLQYYLNEDLEPLSYPTNMLENIRSLGLTRWIVTADEQSLRRENALKTIAEKLRKRQGEFPDFHTDAYFEEIKKALRKTELNTEQADFVGNAVVRLMKEKAGRANPLLFVLLAQSAWDPTQESAQAIDERLKTFLVRSRVATDVSLIQEYIRSVRAITDENIPEQYRTVSEAQLQNAIKAVFVQAANYFERTKDLNLTFSQEQLRSEHVARRERMIVSYSQRLLKEAGLIASHVRPLSYAGLKEALKATVNKLGPSTFITEQLESIGNAEDSADADRVHKEAADKLQKELTELQKLKPGRFRIIDSAKRLDPEIYKQSEGSLLKDIADWKKIGELFGITNKIYVASMLLNQEQYSAYRQYLRQQSLSRYPVLAVELDYKGAKHALWEIFYDMTKGGTLSTPRTFSYMLQGLRISKENLLHSWKTITEARTFKDVEMLMRSPLFHGALRAAFPEYEEVRLEVLGGLGLENTYQRYIGNPIDKTSQFVVFPILLMNVANGLLTKYSGDSMSPGMQFLTRYLLLVFTLKAVMAQQGLIAELAAVWRASTPSFFWMFFYGDFVVGESIMISKNGLGFALEENKEGTGWRFTEPEYLREGRTMFLSSAQGSPLVDNLFYESSKKAYYSRLTSVYFQLAVDAWIATSISRAVMADLRARSGANAQGGSR